MLDEAVMVPIEYFYNSGMRHILPELLDAVLVPGMDYIVEEFDHLRLLFSGHVIGGDIVGVLFDSVNAKGRSVD